MYSSVFPTQVQHSSAIISDMKNSASYIEKTARFVSNRWAYSLWQFSVAIFCHSCFQLADAMGECILQGWRHSNVHPHNNVGHFCDLFRQHNPITKGKMGVRHHIIFSSLQCTLPAFPVNVFISAENCFNSKASQLP